MRSKWAVGKAVRAGLAVEGAYLDRYVTDKQHGRRPIFLLDDQGEQIFSTSDVVAERIRKPNAVALRSIGDIARYHYL